MGLTIHYSFHSPTGSADDARRLVEQLRLHALELPFKMVGEMIDLSGAECDFEKCEKDDPHRWLLVQANQYIERDEHFIQFPPTRLIAFPTWPGEGSEAANFGLCQYPRTVKVRGKDEDTGRPSGWSWSSFCKTQYASNPDHGGVESFLRCHLSLVRLLDNAKTLGILRDVTDEGGYWENRDVKALVEEIAKWNAMIAGFVGRMKDSLEGHTLQSEITNFPNFEHLEAEGRADEDTPGD